MGCAGVGKSSLVMQFIRNLFVRESDIPTMEDSFRKQYTFDGHECFLDILDTAGDLTHWTGMREAYVKHGDAFLLVYAINSRESFKELNSYMEQILRERENVPIILVGNKCDLEDERQVPVVEGENWAKNVGSKFYETSAKARINVEDIFIEAARGCRKKYINNNRGKIASSKKKNDCCIS